MILDAVKQYRDKEIDAHEYDKKMFEGHGILFEYVDLLKESICSKIEITSAGILCYFEFEGRELKMYLDDLQDLCAVPAQLIAYNEYETSYSNMAVNIIKELGEHSVVFDIGANLGWYTLIMDSICHSCDYYLFEPVFETYQRLCRNLQINNIDIDKCHNFGLYHEEREIEFHYDTTASGASSIADLREQESTLKIRCNMRRMDNFVKEKGITRLDFMKCDVEGAELFVYQGGFETIKEFKPIIFSEMLRKWSAKFNYHPNDIIKLLSGIGYQCYVLNKDERLREFGLVDETTVDTNYYFLHTQKHKAILQKFV